MEVGLVEEALRHNIDIKLREKQWHDDIIARENDE